MFSTPATAAGSPTLNSKILILGDSLSAAHNITIEQSWPVLFQEKLKTLNKDNQLINASISGETTEGGLERLQGLLDQHKPTHLILELGGNDGLRGYKFDQTQRNLQTMIEIAIRQNIKVMLIGIRLPPNLGPVYIRRFVQIYQQLADRFPVIYLPNFLQGIAADKPEYMQPDGIHPTALAQPLLAERVFKVFTSQFR